LHRKSRVTFDYMKMKLVLKKQIPEYAELSALDRRKTRKLAEKEGPKTHTILAYLTGLLFCVLTGFAQRYLRETTGSDDYWFMPFLAMLPVVIALSFIWDIFVLNPKIKQVMKNQSNKSSEPTRITPADEDNL